MRKSSWSERIALSLRVGAIVTVLGFVVLAAEQRLTQVVSPQEMISTETAPNFAAASPLPAQAAPEQRAAPKDSDDYFPSHYPAPKGEPETQPDTF